MSLFLNEFSQEEILAYKETYKLLKEKGDSDQIYKSISHNIDLIYHIKHTQAMEIKFQIENL